MADRLEASQQALIEIGTARFPRLLQSGADGRLRFNAAFIAIGVSNLEEVIDDIERLLEDFVVNFGLRSLGEIERIFLRRGGSGRRMVGFSCNGPVEQPASQRLAAAIQARPRNSPIPLLAACSLTAYGLAILAIPQAAKEKSDAPKGQRHAKCRLACQER